MKEDKELQRKVRDNFIVSLATYIKVGRPDDFVHDLTNITNFFSRFHKVDGEIYARLCNSSNEYNIINEKVEELINYIKKVIMGSSLKDLKKYLKDTPGDVIEKDMNDLDKYNETGPDMLDILPDQNIKTDGCSIDDIFRIKV